ncbi:Stc1 domain-containing protein [Phaeosphaeriaceae sp. PMI808]|nr:Stc1 domain-containing protein [Phaeosphaeriaceae sp. PMI808]
MGRKNKAKRTMFSEAELEEIQTVTLPPKIKCGRCNKHLSVHQYSDNQKNEYCYQRLHQGRISKPMICRTCTGGQVIDIECVFCHETKGAEEFAKSQRQDTDTARCFDCTEELAAREPVKEESYERLEKAFTKPVNIDDTITHYYSSANSVDGSWTDESGGVTLPKQLQSMSISDSQSGILIGEEYPWATGQQSAGTRTGSWHTGSSNAASSNNGFATNKTGKPSTAYDVGTERSYASSVAERSDGTDVPSNGWAKTPGGPAVMV